jgi:hypothetical protein
MLMKKINDKQQNRLGASITAPFTGALASSFFLLSSLLLLPPSFARAKHDIYGAY